MGSIMDIKAVLTQKALKTFSETFHILDEVHPQLPSPNQTIHEMPTRKIGVYTRLFKYANFQLPLSTFLVDVLRYYSIYIYQLSIIAAAKVSHFEVMCRVHGFELTVGLFRCFYVNSKNKGWMSFSKRPGNDAVCYTKPLDSLKGWNDHFFWVDAFACPISFPWHTSKSVSTNPVPKSSEFNAEHYASLVAYPDPFHKYPKPFLCLVGISRHYTLDENTYPAFQRENDEVEMDLLSFIQTANPTKVRVGERKHDEDEPKLLDATIGRVVQLLQIMPARGESELEDNMDKLFGKGGSGDQVEQGDSASGGQGVGIQFVSDATKQLRDDHGTLSGASVGGKSRSVVQRLLTRAVQNAKVRGEIVPTLPFVTSSVSATPEREDETHTDSVAGTNLQTFGPPPRFVISSNSSHHFDANVAEAEVDSIVRSSAPVMTTATIVTTTVLKETFVKPSLFAAGSSSAGGNEPILGGFSDLTGNDFLVGGIHTVINPDSDLEKVYVSRWNVTNGSHLDDGGVRCEMIDEFAPLKFFVSIRGMEHDQIFTEFNVGAARQMSLSAEVRMRTKYNIKEKRRLKSIVDEQTEVLKAREKEIEDLRAQLLLKETETAEAIRLHAKVSQCKVVERMEHEVANLDAQVIAIKLQSDNQAHQEKVTVYEDYMSQLEKFQDEWMRVVNDKFNKLYTDFVEIALHLEEKFYSHLLMTIAGRRWLLTYGMKLAIVKCLHSPEYLSALGVAISKAIEKRKMELQDVNISLLAELKSNKDASVETLMGILRLEETLDERLGLNEAQPHVNQPMVPIHHSLNQTIVSATGLSFSLDVSHNRVQKIRDNIANHRSALCDMFVPLVEPLSSAALEGTEGTSGAAPDTTTNLSTTYASASSILPISTDDYVVVHADSQEGAGADVNPLPNVDDAELNIS
ncbi:hypothetical protein Tco_1159882 [Tanacetum coccineum]